MISAEECDCLENESNSLNSNSIDTTTIVLLISLAAVLSILTIVSDTFITLLSSSYGLSLQISAARQIATILSLTVTPEEVSAILIANAAHYFVIPLCSNVY